MIEQMNKKFREFQEQESEKILEPKIISLFKILNEEKKNHKTRKSLLDAIENYASFLGIDPQFSLYILELYLLNYRKDGNYKGLTKDNFVDPRKMKGKWTPNTKTNKFTVALLPFKGSNLEGYWDKDPQGKEFYVVKSYDWYPIFIFKDNKWYEVTNRYSSSTSRQMSNASPIKYSEEVQDNVFLLSLVEMKMLMSGKSHEDVLQNKLIQIKKDEPSLLSKKITTKDLYHWGEDYNLPKVKIKYKIKGIRIEGDKAIVDVDIHDIVKRQGSQSIDTPENYLKGELGGITKDYVENYLSSNLSHKFRDYMGKHFYWREVPSDRHKVVFNFNHLKK